MVTVNDILTLLTDFAPPYMKYDFDNVGLLVGDRSAEVSRVLLSLDITSPVIAEAERFGAQLIVSHHPLIFQLKSVTGDSVLGRKVLELARRSISAICMHTNLDSADGGVNDALLAAVGARCAGLLAPHGSHPDGRPYGVSRIGVLPQPEPMPEFLAQVRRALNVNAIRYHDSGRPVSRLAVCGGSGGGELDAAIAAGCDTLLTADVKYDQFLQAAEQGVNLMDADHFCTENVVVPVLAERISTAFPALDVRISEVHGQTAQIFI